MNENLTEIVCVIDKSGSMEVLKSEAISGFNYFLKNQQELPGIAIMSLVLFDDGMELVYDRVSIDSVKSLNEKLFKTGGSTALLDAVGYSIDSIGKKLYETPEEQRPGNVIFAILTDGEENSSTKFTYKEIAEKIKHQRDVYKWEFIFLAANQDAIASASKISIAADDAFNFDASSKGIKKAMNLMDSRIMYCRTKMPKRKKNL